jgi:hypothetical protein
MIVPKSAKDGETGMRKSRLCLAMGALLCRAAPAAADGLDDFLDNWSPRAHAALANEPHWAPPINTPSPRLTQVVRYDQYWQSTGTPAAINGFGAGKGVEIIPFDTTSFTFNFPPYSERSKAAPAAGFADWPAVFVKQRLATAPPDEGDYVLTGYLTVQAPLGIAELTNHTWVVTPGLGFGKGWGDFDLDGSVTIALPTAHMSTVGTAIAANLAAQYHLGRYFWPELELNGTGWAGGPRSGLNQLFMTAGTVFGTVPLADNYGLGVGAGYQFALTRRDYTALALTPAYDHNWILTFRLVY